VANGGDPIPKAAIEKLFEPFFRGDVRASNCTLPRRSRKLAMAYFREFDGRGSWIYLPDATALAGSKDVAFWH
jgi:hypothetical protein